MTNPEVKYPTSQGFDHTKPPLGPATHTAEVNPMPISGFAPPIPQTGIAYPAPTANGLLAAALAKAQGEMKAAVYNRINPHFKNRYADLASVIDAIRGPLSKHGIGYTQIMEMEPEFRLVTTLHHNSGETVSSYYPLPVNAKPQELGSALTYARRYSLSAITGIAADEDDDAEAASKIDNSLVTPEQVEHLDILAADVPESTKSQTLAYISGLTKKKIDKFEAIPASQFATAYGILEKKRTGKTPPKEPPK